MHVWGRDDDSAGFDELGWPDIPLGLVIYVSCCNVFMILVGWAVWNVAHV